jgi:hypothetical protein
MDELDSREVEEIRRFLATRAGKVYAEAMQKKNSKIIWLGDLRERVARWREDLMLLNGIPVVQSPPMTILGFMSNACGVLATRGAR